MDTKDNILSCRPASLGKAEGHPTVVLSEHDLDSVKDGDVLVAIETDISYVPAMQRASAIVTERGGRFCHAAVWARENQKPTVLQAINATVLLANKDIVIVDANEGTIKW
jgi:pyruvate,water dikinase